MIYKDYNFSELEQKVLTGDCQSCLFYGQNHGLGKVLSDGVIAKIGYDKLIILDYGEIASDIENVINGIFYSQSLFPTKSVIKIFNVKDKLSKTISKIFSQSHNNQNQCYLFLFSDGSDIRNLRSLYEKDKQLGVVPCYQDDERVALSQITSFCNTNNVAISKATQVELSKILFGDRLNLVMEMNKIKIYLTNHKGTDKDIFNLIIPATEHSYFNFIDNFLVNNIIALREFDKCIQSEEINLIAIIRLAISHFNDILKIKTSKNIEESLSSRSFFFKRLPYIKKQITSLDIATIKRTIVVLSDYEIICKVHGEEVAVAMFRWKILNKH